MRRRRADAAAGLLLGAIILSGGALAWQAYRQRRAFEESMGSMMDTSMETMHGPDPLWFVFGTLLIATVVGGVYILLRPELTSDGGPDRPGSIDAAPTTQNDGESTNRDPARADPVDPESDTADGRSVNPEANPTERVLDLLPEDERRILEPVLDSPGITQIELRDRAEFSKSKVSQTVSDLEERGLLYRERQGRTYRIYPSEDLERNGAA
ncbi:helix-turn-helix transcriptional regulator [Halorhabdus amylolytica]|uniref:helix-turn-helix transcriptional regulator n=1 Tax=Halorhabdus amylolytica TaxID=2559573 RepID=UPI0010AA84FF|nr:MarR family transcriptional regulator [Halorhabdus amylolytica]